MTLGKIEVRPWRSEGSSAKVSVADSRMAGGSTFSPVFSQENASEQLCGRPALPSVRKGCASIGSTARIIRGSYPNRLCPQSRGQVHH